jgi:malto-oligosyltrehalose trehalohydrolase
VSARYASASPFGANLQTDGKTRFSLWAPAANSVHLELRGAAALPMLRDAQGLFELVAQCPTGTRYRYLIDGQLSVPDPASRGQDGDVHGYSMLVDPMAYAWSHPRWSGRPWHESVIYELHIGCFGGSYTAVAARLAHLADLGVTAVQLMPVADFSGSRNWGYDGVLPYAPDTAYGTPDELKALIDAAHGLGLCLYLDVVYNHFGSDGNYLHRYAPQFFDDRRSSAWGTAIDYSRPQVREFFIANALYWLMEDRFDGLRLDAVHAIGDSTFLDQLAMRARAATEPGRHIHLMLENEANDAQRLQHGYDAQWIDDGHNVLHVLLTGETEGYYGNYRQAPAAKLARCLAQGFVYQGEPSPSHGDRPRGSPSGHRAPSCFILFLQNHDQVGNRAFGERLTTLRDPRALRAAITLQLLSPQAPLIFMGEEWGARQPFLYFTAFDSELGIAVRDGRRQELAAFANFADPQRRATIPDPNAQSSYLQSVLDDVRDEEQRAQLDFYRRLLHIRRTTLAPRLAAASSLGARAVGAAAIAASWRLGGGDELWIGINLGQDPVTVDPPLGSLLFESQANCSAAAAAGSLAPLSCTVYFRAHA